MASDETNMAPADARPDGTAANGVEAANAAAGAAGNPIDVTILDAELEAANRKAEEAHEAFLRARGYYANYNRRVEDERESLRQFVSSDLLARLLPIVDNFERALAAAAQTTDYEKLVTGVNAVYRQIQEFLAREGVAPIDALFQPFDPNVHNAVLREETTEHPENTVVEELQKGYTLNGKVLRPTMVKVATGAE
jgi:molecular chaperone GrpE